MKDRKRKGEVECLYLGWYQPVFTFRSVVSRFRPLTIKSKRTFLRCDVHQPFPSRRLEAAPLKEEFALGFELVLIVDSAGELALESWARLSRSVAVSPSVKLQILKKKMVDYNSLLKICWYTRRWRSGMSGANFLPIWTWLTCQCRLFHHFLRVSSISAECHVAGFPCETGTWLSESKSSLNCWRWHRKQC